MRSKRGRLSNLKKSPHGSEDYDSHLERDYTIELERDAAVASWTKRHGVVIPYRFLGFPRRYFPDFLVTFRDGSQELHETKGLPLMLWLSTRLKRESAEDFCRRNGWGYKLLTRGMRW